MQHDLTIAQDRDYLARQFDRLAEVEQLRALILEDIDGACDELDDEALEVVFTELERTR